MTHFIRSQIHRHYPWLALTILLAFVNPAFSQNAYHLGLKGEEHSSIGIYIKDLSTDSVLVDRESLRGLTPASITKALTSATAMNVLPVDFTFKTRVYLTGQSGSDGAWDGDIIIKAGGDPTLESEFFPKNCGFEAEIINALKSKGITKITGQIILEKCNTTHQYTEGPLDCWEIDDTVWAYGAGIFDFNYKDNYFSLWPATGRTNPPVPDLRYTVWSNPWSSGLDMMRGVYSDSLIIMSQGADKDAKKRINTSMPYPFDAFRQELTASLSKAGIELEGKPDINRPMRELLVCHNSPKLDTILRSLMVRSDNMFAEGMLRTFGDRYGDRSASIRAELQLWKSKGLATDFVTIKDGSGLSRGDCISPRFMAEMLEYMAKSPLASRYVPLFPVAGRDGTMANFMKKTPLDGKLAMKTGSMSAVQCYAGYMLDDDGHPTHVIVIMANNFYCSRSELKTAISDMLLDVLVEKTK